MWGTAGAAAVLPCVCSNTISSNSLCASDLGTYYRASRIVRAVAIKGPFQLFRKQTFLAQVGKLFKPHQRRVSEIGVAEIHGSQPFLKFMDCFEQAHMGLMIRSQITK